MAHIGGTKRGPSGVETAPVSKRAALAGETFEETRARRLGETKAFFASLSPKEARDELASSAGEGFVERIGGHFDVTKDPSGRSRVLNMWLPLALGKMAKSVLEAASLYGVQCTLEQAKEACRNKVGGVVAMILLEYCNGIGGDGLILEGQVADVLSGSALPEDVPPAADAVELILQILGPDIVEELRAEIEGPKPSDKMALDHATDPLTVQLVERIKAHGREAPVAGSNKPERSGESKRAAE
tara:strand:+ start:941 stop:1669 length:729 start_codon:yes stop_codon:yes gene_type:complete